MNISFFTTSFVKNNDYSEDLSKVSSAQSNSRDIDESGSIYHSTYNENFIMKNFLQFPTKCEFSFTWWMCIVHTNCYLEWVDRNFESFKLLCRLLQATSIPMMWRCVVWCECVLGMHLFSILDMMSWVNTVVVQQRPSDIANQNTSGRFKW